MFSNVLGFFSHVFTATADSTTRPGHDVHFLKFGARSCFLGFPPQRLQCLEAPPPPQLQSDSRDGCGQAWAARRKWSGGKPAVERYF